VPTSIIIQRIALKALDKDTAAGIYRAVSIIKMMPHAPGMLLARFVVDATSLLLLYHQTLALIMNC